MIVFIAYFVTGISTTAFLALWFVTAYREIISQERAMTDIANQVRMHQKLCEKAQKSPDETAAKSMFDNSRYIYQEAVKSYNCTILKPMNRFPGWVMGFRAVPRKE